MPRGKFNNIQYQKGLFDNEKVFLFYVKCNT